MADPMEIDGSEEIDQRLREALTESLRNDAQATPPDQQGNPTQAVNEKPGKKKLYKLSYLAKKYGAENFRLPEGTRDGHTGLSPVSFARTTDEKELILRYTKALDQKRGANGWSTRDLIDIDAFNAYPDQSRPRYPNWGNSALHPLVEKARWRTQADLGDCEAFLPIGNGIKGYYCVDNEEVWRLMLPALKLASNMLDATEDSQWWNAFLDPDQYTITDTPTEWRRVIFHSKKGPVSIEDRMKIKRRLREAAPYIKIQVANAQVSTAHSRLLHAPQKEDEASWTTLGCATYWVRPGGVEDGREENQALITLDYKWVYDLVKGSLDAPEIEATQFAMASTLVHEIAHALWRVMTFTTNPLKQHPVIGGEPYYENEIIKELGWSMMNSFMGVYKNHSHTPPVLSLFTRHWPTSFDRDICPVKPEALLAIEQGTLKLPAYGMSYQYPIPGSYYYQMLTQKFWDERGRIGGKSFKVPALQGRRDFTGDINTKDNYHRIDIAKVQRTKGAASLTEFHTDRYGFATNEFQELLANFMARTKHRHAQDRSLEMPAKSALKKNFYGISAWSNIPEDPRLDELGAVDDFEYEQLYPIPEPPTAPYIYDVVHLAREWCCFDGQTMLRPAHFVLGYINRTVQEMNKVPGGRRFREIEQDEWLDFLEYVSTAKIMFNYCSYDGIRKHNNCPRGSGVESVSCIADGWDLTRPVFERPKLEQPIMDANDEEALEAFQVYMFILSGYGDKPEQFTLIKSSLDWAFFSDNDSEDYDSATFNRRYNIFAAREREEIKRTQRDKWKGPAPHLSLEVMRWAIDHGKIIAGWRRGPFDTMRFQIEDCVSSYTLEESLDLWRGMEKDMEEHLNTQRYEREKQAGALGQTMMKEFFRDSFQPLVDIMFEKLQRDGTLTPEMSHTQIKEYWHEMQQRRARARAQASGETLTAQVQEELGRSQLIDSMTRVEAMRLRQIAQEAERKKVREELLGRWGEFMQKHWYTRPGSAPRDGKADPDGFVAIYELEQALNDVVGDVVGEMGDDAIRSLSWDLQNHIVILIDLQRIVTLQSAMHGMGAWGAPIPDAYLLPTRRRMELASLEMQRDVDALERAPQWYCTEEQRGRLNAIIKWRADNPIKITMMGETECAKWEREQKEIREREVREGRAREARRPEGVFNPVPVEGATLGARGRTGGKRKATVSDERSRSPVAKRRREKR